MTDVKEPAVIEEALAIIDAGLGGLTDRQLVSTNEITDLLLDVRSLLSDQVTVEVVKDAPVALDAEALATIERLDEVD